MLHYIAIATLLQEDADVLAAYGILGGKLGSETPTHKPRGSQRAKKRRIFSAKANSYRIIIGQGMKSLGKIFMFDTQSKMSLL